MEALHGQPGLQQADAVFLEDASDDVDARRAQVLTASGGGVAGVGDRVDDAGDAGLDECHGAGSGPAGVVAGLEGHDGGRAARGPVRELRQCVDLRVSGSGAAVPALREDLAGG